MIGHGFGPGGRFDLVVTFEVKRMVKRIGISEIMRYNSEMV